MLNESEVTEPLAVASGLRIQLEMDLHALSPAKASSTRATSF
jgi:hypothetical protein